MAVIYVFNAIVNGPQAIMLHREPASLPFVASLGTAENAESQRVLLRITTDHFISRQDHSAQQLAQFEKTMLRLIARADPSTRLIVARKLASHPLTPPRALAMIEEMGGEGGLHVLECAPLPRDRLLAAALGNESRACALAKRADLDADLVSTLSVRPETSVVLTLACNLAAPIDSQTLAVLARRAEREKPLADALLARPCADIDRAALFILATSEQRASILVAAQRMAFGRATTGPSMNDHHAAIASLENHALEREPALFNHALSEALGCSRDLAERIATEPSGEPLAVALAALGAAQDVAVRILISGDLQSGAKYSRIGALVRLKDGLNSAAARRVIAALIGAPKERRAHYQPVLDPQASKTPSRGAATPLASGLGATPEAQRRQRAFAFSALHEQAVKKSG
jgi:uncharacterized protein (DUF2336 family)